jgi:ABC-type phosphonate transport system ATPase subunit
MTADPLLLVKSLRMQFGGLRALDNVDLQVGPGQVVGLTMASCNHPEPSNDPHHHRL